MVIFAFLYLKTDFLKQNKNRGRTMSRIQTLSHD